MNGKFFVLMLLALVLLAPMIGLSLYLPAETLAHPQYGFTPQPPPPPPPPPPEQPPRQETARDSRDDRGPTDVVSVQLDICISICPPVAGGEAGQVGEAGSEIEVLAPVQLIHQGSGWIATATLSNLRSAQLAVPYPGQWQVFLVDRPEFPAATFEAAGFGQVQLLSSPDGESVLLGVVEANVGVTQLVDCPVCVAPPPVEEVTLLLPVTGTGRLSPLEIAAFGLILIGLGLLVRFAATDFSGGQNDTSF
jgi:hypothetical protein